VFWILSAGGIILN